MTTPERLMEREIERGTDGRTLILLACGCAKVAVMSSAKEETILLDMFRAMWDAVNGTGNRHDYYACQRYPIAFDGRNRHEWIVKSALDIASITARPFVVRPHPGAMMCEPDKALAIYRALHDTLGDRVQVSENTLASDLRNAWAVVTYDSNIAVEAVIAGTPAFTGGRSMAERVACLDLSRIEDPPRLDRTQWAHWIANCQWTTDELRAGTPWQVLMGVK